jgi:hypothetical protein
MIKLGIKGLAGYKTRMRKIILKKFHFVEQIRSRDNVRYLILAGG